MAAEAGAGDRPETVWPRRLDDETATQELAADIAQLVGPGDLVTLSGGLGARQDDLRARIDPHCSRATPDSKCQARPSC